MERLMEKYLDKQNELKKLHNSFNGLQDDMEIVTYLDFKSNKYYGGEYVKVEYDNGDVEVGILQFSISGVYVLEEIYINNPHYHKIPNLNRRITKITRLYQRKISMKITRNIFLCSRCNNEVTKKTWDEVDPNNIDKILYCENCHLDYRLDEIIVKGED